MGSPCQVDFYVLAPSAPSAGHLACRLSLRAWEQGHRVSVLAASEEDARRLDELMWDFPPGRFLPHELDPADADVPVVIVYPPSPLPADRDVVVNLTAEAVPEPACFKRLLEIVPAEPRLRESSRSKFRAYRGLGLEPKHHDIQTF
jgi:DNA polymerase-3 subunit chi